MSSNDPNVNYKSITENLLETIDKQASLKTIMRSKQALWINKDLEIAIYTRNRLRNKYWQETSRQNELAYKK